MITVTEWINYDDVGDREESCGGIGGFFNFDKEGMRWKDYIAIFGDETKPYLEALRKEVIDKGIRITDDDHQNAPDGVPLFNDGTVGTFSFRAWGDLMAAIWSEEENKDYNYMDFYM